MISRIQLSNHCKPPIELNLKFKKKSLCLRKLENVYIVAIVEQKTFSNTYKMVFWTPYKINNGSKPYSKLMFSKPYNNLFVLHLTTKGCVRHLTTRYVFGTLQQKGVFGTLQQNEFCTLCKKMCVQHLTTSLFFCQPWVQHLTTIQRGSAPYKHCCKQGTLQNWNSAPYKTTTRQKNKKKSVAT